MAGRCPLCNGEHNGEAERFGFQAEGHIRIPLGDGTDAVWFVCDQHKVRWRENYHRESWTPELSNDDERAPHERDWTLGRLCEHRTHLLSRYREVEPYDEASPCGDTGPVRRRALEPRRRRRRDRALHLGDVEIRTAHR